MTKLFCNIYLKMSIKCIFEKIKSKYLFERIFEYASKKSEECKLKLIIYSKLLQKNFGINIIDYQYFYLKNLYNYESYNRIDFKLSNFDNTIYINMLNQN